MAKAYVSVRAGHTDLRVSTTALKILKCRFGCEEPPAAIVYLPGGCACFPDTVQALCAQHIASCSPVDGIHWVVATGKVVGALFGGKDGEDAD